jgi:hypothetical protein
VGLCERKSGWELPQAAGPTPGMAPQMRSPPMWGRCPAGQRGRCPAGTFAPPCVISGRIIGKLQGLFSIVALEATAAADRILSIRSKTVAR